MGDGHGDRAAVRTVNLELDLLIRRIVREPALLDEATLAMLGSRVSEAEIQLLLDKDLAGLRARDAHPLLLMQFAGAFRIEAMPALGRQAPHPPQQ